MYQLKYVANNIITWRIKKCGRFVNFAKNKCLHTKSRRDNVYLYVEWALYRHFHPGE